MSTPDSAGPVHVKKPRVCPECGSDTYFAENFDRVRDKLHAVEQAMKRMASQHAIAAATWELEKLDRQNGNAWLQRKVAFQRGVISRLERRLRALGQQPHAPETPGAEGTTNR